MRIKKQFIFLVILLNSFFLPLHVATVPQVAAQENERITYVWAAGGVGGDLGDWDPAIDSTTQFNALESLLWLDVNNNLHPLLVTGWTIDERPEEGGNTGGIESITFQIRQGVTFHDGSEWNATVAKWNLDRITHISGYVNSKWQSRYWVTTGPMKPYFTASWNLSWAEFDPFDVLGSSVRVPMLNETTVLGPYELKVTYNKWATNLEIFSSIEMISMETYKDYAEEAIRGYGDVAPYLDTTVEHLVGTGPYKLDFIDKLYDVARAIKNENYWNKTALEADGMFVVDDFYTRFYGDSGARTSALFNQEADASSHAIGNALADLDAIKASPDLDFYETTYDTSMDTITMLGEEGSNKPLAHLGGTTFRQAYYDNTGLTLATGINRTVRRALSYAFNYDDYFSAVYSGSGGIQCYTPLGSESIWYDGTAKRPDTNVTIARQILFEDPYYAAELTSRGLSLSSNDAEWENVGLTNGIQNLTYLASTGSVHPSYFGSALNSLGFGLGDVTYSSSIYMEWMITGKSLLFDAWSYTWPSDKRSPMEWFGSGMNLVYASYNLIMVSGGFNFALLQNSTIDQYMADALFAGGQTAQDIYNNLSYDLMYYHSPWLYLAHGALGVAINPKWIVSPYCLSAGIAVHLLGLEGLNLKADFTANTTLIHLDNNIVQFTFTGYNGNGTTSFQWNFGDGSANSTARNPVHTYQSLGNFTVTLTVADTGGDTDVITKENYISLVDLIPTADFVANATLIDLTDIVQFTFTGTDGDEPASFQWNFGDGSANLTERNPVHQYESKGNYTVILTVTDADGDSNVKIKIDYIQVLPYNNPSPDPDPDPNNDPTGNFFNNILGWSLGIGGLGFIIAILSFVFKRRGSKLTGDEPLFLN
jgi:ABC-type transport system substrate-binding protein